MKAFQNGDDPLFLISLKAGGVGLNLTAADYVIILTVVEPSSRRQGADRAYRIGQDKPVMVYRIVTTDSIEERVLKLQSEKRKLVGDLAPKVSLKPSKPAMLKNSSPSQSTPARSSLFSRPNKNPAIIGGVFVCVLL